MYISFVAMDLRFSCKHVVQKARIQILDTEVFVHNFVYLGTYPNAQNWAVPLETMGALMHSIAHVPPWKDQQQEEENRNGGIRQNSLATCSCT